MARDYYGLLGVSKGASDSEVKRAYRRLARELHPDVNPDEEAQARFTEIQVAYEVLSDPEKRRIVDMGGDPMESVGGAPGGFSGFGGLGDVFEAFFGGGTASRGPVGRVRPGADSLLRMRLDLAECATGVTKQVTVDTAVLCDLCHGKGTNGNSTPVACDTCDGRGEIQTVQRSLLGQVMTTRPCPVCGGIGEVIPDPCHRCGGDGRVRARREISVKIPAGDLYVEVHEKQHEIFVRDGDDLHCTVSVPMVDAALGTTVSVDAILDGPTELTIAAGTQPGSVTTLRGHGMPHLRSGVRGDLHAHIDVVVPSRLDSTDTDLLRKLKENRSRDAAEVRSTQAAASSGGLFSRLRETFSGR